MIGNSGSRIVSFSCFCEPRIVRLAAMTKPAWLNGLRHQGVSYCCRCCPYSRVRDSYRLAFDVPSKAFTCDSRGRTKPMPAGPTGQVRGGIQIPTSHPAEGGLTIRIPLPPALSQANFRVVPRAPMSYREPTLFDDNAPRRTMRERLHCGNSCTRKSAGHCAGSSPLPVTPGQSA